MADKVSALLLFGATGDLARRMLLPSLYGLDADGLLWITDACNHRVGFFTLDGTLVRFSASTLISPFSPSETPTSSRPSPSVLGLRPVANRTASASISSQPSMSMKRPPSSRLSIRLKLELNRNSMPLVIEI